MILRGAVLFCAGAAFAAGLAALLLRAFPPAFVFGFWGRALVIGTLYERVRYKNLLARAPGAGWERSPERFIDPQSGQPVTVYVDPVSGERQYVQE